MLDNEKLNNLAKLYADTRSNDAFSDLYAAILPEFKRRWSRPGIDPHDCEEAFHVALQELTRNWREENGDFLKMMNIRYKSRLTDRMRKSKRRSDNEYSIDVPTDDDADKVAALYEDKREDTELTVIKKMTDHGLQSVISHLLHPAKSDIATTVIVAALQFTPFTTPNALGKAAGLNHEVVRRKLRALSRNYDASRFGDIHDYIAV